MIRNLSTTILRGDKVGIIGANASGKTTLIRLLLGELPPRTGTIRHGTRLEIAYFDQLKATLDENKTVQQNISDYDTIPINGQPRHIIGYLQDFLFAPERSRSLVKFLSGGERSRLLLARLFTKPSNLLVLDEPTNDLDIETLELLESLLVEYQGTVLLVSHDRAFLNDVVTSTLAIEADGRVGEYDGGYDDYMRQRPEPMTGELEGCRSQSTGAPASQTAEKRKKLSFKERREMESLPGGSRISSLSCESCTRRWPTRRSTSETKSRSLRPRRNWLSWSRRWRRLTNGGKFWNSLPIDRSQIAYPPPHVATSLPIWTLARGWDTMGRARFRSWNKNRFASQYLLRGSKLTPGLPAQSSLEFRR